MRRTIVNTTVGAGTPRKYLLPCPRCGIINHTPDAGGVGVLTKDGKVWYRFNCACGVRYKAEMVPFTVGLSRVEDIFGGSI